MNRKCQKQLCLIASPNAMLPGQADLIPLHNSSSLCPSLTGLFPAEAQPSGPAARLQRSVVLWANVNVTKQIAKVGRGCEHMTHQLQALQGEIFPQWWMSNEGIRASAGSDLCFPSALMMRKTPVLEKMEGDPQEKAQLLLTSASIAPRLTTASWTPKQLSYASEQ